MVCAEAKTKSIIAIFGMLEQATSLDGAAAAARLSRDATSVVARMEEFESAFASALGRKFIPPEMKFLPDEVLRQFSQRMTWAECAWSCGQLSSCGGFTWGDKKRSHLCHLRGTDWACGGDAQRSMMSRLDGQTGSDVRDAESIDLSSKMYPFFDVDDFERGLYFPSADDDGFSGVANFGYCDLYDAGKEASIVKRLASVGYDLPLQEQLSLSAGAPDGTKLWSSRDPPQQRGVKANVWSTQTLLLSFTSAALRGASRSALQVVHAGELTRAVEGLREKGNRREWELLLRQQEVEQEAEQEVEQLRQQYEKKRMAAEFEQRIQNRASDESDDQGWTADETAAATAGIIFCAAIIAFALRRKRGRRVSKRSDGCRSTRNVHRSDESLHFARTVDHHPAAHAGVSISYDSACDGDDERFSATGSCPAMKLFKSPSAAVREPERPIATLRSSSAYFLGKPSTCASTSTCDSLGSSASGGIDVSSAAFRETCLSARTSLEAKQINFAPSCPPPPAAAGTMGGRQSRATSESDWERGTQYPRVSEYERQRCRGAMDCSAAWKTVTTNCPRMQGYLASEAPSGDVQSRAAVCSFEASSLTVSLGKPFSVAVKRRASTGSENISSLGTSQSNFGEVPRGFQDEEEEISENRFLTRRSVFSDTDGSFLSARTSLEAKQGSYGSGSMSSSSGICLSGGSSLGTSQSCGELAERSRIR